MGKVKQICFQNHYNTFHVHFYAHRISYNKKEEVKMRNKTIIRDEYPKNLVYEIYGSVYADILFTGDLSQIRLAQICNILDKMIKHLDFNEKNVIELYFKEGKSLKEISKMSHQTQTNIIETFKTARKKLVAPKISKIFFKQLFLEDNLIKSVKMEDNVEVLLGQSQNENIKVTLEGISPLFVTGETGCGKSSFLKNLIISILKQQNNKCVKLVLIDTKKTEFKMFEKIKNLINHKVLSSQDEVSRIILELLREKSLRQNRFKSLNIKSMEELNNLPCAVASKQKNIAKIFVFIDEVSDVINNVYIQTGLKDLAKDGANYGIYIIVATQRPNLSSNGAFCNLLSSFPCKIIFNIESGKDWDYLTWHRGEKTELDNGEAILFDGQNCTAKIQIPFLSDKEILKQLQEGNLLY